MTPRAATPERTVVRWNAARRDDILRRYGLPPGTHPDYEIDHLIPLCLGGSDDPSNLWAQPRRSIEETWNAEAKDRLERLMCRMVCDGQIDIATAQEAFATDWIHTMYYNFVRVNQTLKMTPAMAVGVTSRLWEMTDLVEMIEAFEVLK